jgi:hypothetical protein
MLLEIKKEKNKFVLINPPKKVGTHFWIETEANKIIPISKTAKKSNNYIYKAVKKMASKYPDNEFLKISLDLTPINYTYSTELSNEMLLNDALTEKYGI